MPADGLVVLMGRHLPKNRGGRVRLLNPAGDTDVCEKHELLHQRVGFQLLLLFNVNWSSRLRRVQVNLEFRR